MVGHHSKVMNDIAHMAQVLAEEKRPTRTAGEEAIHYRG